MTGCLIFINGKPARTVSSNVPTSSFSFSFSLRVELPNTFSNEFANELIGTRGGHASSLAENKAMWFISLGSLRNGRSAGGLGFRYDSIPADIGKTSSLIYDSVDTSEIPAPTRVNGCITRIDARDVTVLVDTFNANSTWFDIRVCRPNTITPFITYRVSSETGSGGAGMRIDKLEDGVQWTTVLRQQPNRWDRYDWRRSASGVASIDHTIPIIAGGDGTATTTITGTFPNTTETVVYGFNWSAAIPQGRVKTKVFTSVNGKRELASETWGDPATALSPKTSYDYYINNLGLGWAGAVKSVVEPSGRWTKYDYFNTTLGTVGGRISRIYRPWKDSPATVGEASPTAGYVETFEYGTDFDGTQRALTKRTVHINGTQVGRTDWTYNWALGSVNSLAYFERQEKNYSSATNFLTTTRRAFKPDLTDTFLAGRPHAVIRPDGTKDAFAYYKGTWDPSTQAFAASTSGNDRLVLTFHGQTSTAAGAVSVSSWTQGTVVWSLDTLFLISNLSTVSESVIDTNGRVVFSAENIYNGSGIERIAGKAVIYNGNNLVSAEKDISRSVPGADVAATYAYSAGLLTQKTEIDGVKTNYTYDTFLRSETVVTGATGSGAFPAKTQTFTYYPSGLKKTAQDCSCSPNKTTYTYDAAGRITKLEEPQPGAAGGLLTSTYTYFNPQRSTKVIDAKGAETTSNIYLDGQAKSVTGTGVVAQSVDFSVDSSGLVTKITQNASSPDNGWVEETSDWLGRAVKQRTPQVGWTSATPSKAISRVSTYDTTTGQLLAVDTTDDAAGGIKILPTKRYVYGRLGALVQEGEDVDNSGALSDISNDRIVKYDVQYYKEVGAYNGWLRQELVRTLRSNTSAELTIVSDRRIRLTRFNNGAANGTSRIVGDVVSFDSSGRYSVDVQWVDPVATSRTQYHAEQGVSQAAFKTWLNGYLQYEQTLSGVVENYTYSAAGLLASFTKGTTNSATTYAYYPGTGQVSSISRTTGASTVATTTFDYSWSTSSKSRTVKATDAAGKVSYTEFNALDQPWRTWGSGSQPSLHTYDAFGRLTKLTTWATTSGWTDVTFPASPGAGSEVTWTLDPATGVATTKTYADGKQESYTYNARGQVKSRTGARNLVTNYNYNDAAANLTGELQAVLYTTASGVTTPNLSFTYNRFGGIAGVTDATGSRSFAYRADLKPSSETLDGAYFANRVITYNYDSIGRAAGYSVNGDKALTQTTGYDPATGRVNSISGAFEAGGAATFALTYLPGTDFVGSVTSGSFARTFTIENRYEVIKSVRTTWGGVNYGTFSAEFAEPRGLQSSVISGASTHGGAWNRQLGLGDGIKQSIQYDDQGQLTGTAAPTWTGAGGVASLATRAFGWTYDNKGNRLAQTVNQATTYTANANNQYTSITGGLAESTITHDADGNLDRDGTWTYTYDHENRVASMSKSGQTLTFTYDYLGRRVRKVVTGTGAADTKFLWSGWTHIGDIDGTGAARRIYVWGPDFSDARGAAGGAGALLAQLSSAAGSERYAMADQHGSIVGYINNTGSIVAAKEFGAFGQELANSGTTVDNYAYWYSAKYTDKESGLVYYGMRYYQPKHGRFINRDPIGEQGGNNLYAMCRNLGVNGWDVLGLECTYEGSFEIPGVGIVDHYRCTKGDSPSGPPSRRYGSGGENSLVDYVVIGTRISSEPQPSGGGSGAGSGNGGSGVPGGTSGGGGGGGGGSDGSSSTSNNPDQPDDESDCDEFVDQLADSINYGVPLRERGDHLGAVGQALLINAEALRNVPQHPVSGFRPELVEGRQQSGVYRHAMGNAGARLWNNVTFTSFGALNTPDQGIGLFGFLYQQSNDAWQMVEHGWGYIFTGSPDHAVRYLESFPEMAGNWAGFKAGGLLASGVNGEMSKDEVREKLRDLFCR